MYLTFNHCELFKENDFWHHCFECLITSDDCRQKIILVFQYQSIWATKNRDDVVSGKGEYSNLGSRINTGLCPT